MSTITNNTSWVEVVKSSVQHHETIRIPPAARAPIHFNTSRQKQSQQQQQQQQQSQPLYRPPRRPIRRPLRRHYQPLDRPFHPSTSDKPAPHRSYSSPQQHERSYKSPRDRISSSPLQRPTRDSPPLIPSYPSPKQAPSLPTYHQSPPRHPPYHSPRQAPLQPPVSVPAPRQRSPYHPPPSLPPPHVPPPKKTAPSRPPMRAPLLPVTTLSRHELENLINPSLNPLSSKPIKHTKQALPTRFRSAHSILSDTKVKSRTIPHFKQKQKVFSSKKVFAGHSAKLKENIVKRDTRRATKSKIVDHTHHSTKLFVIGRNDYYQFGLNHKEKTKALTDWSTHHNHDISVDSVHVSLAGLIVTDCNGEFWSMGCNQHGECAVPNIDNKGYIMQPSKIAFFTENGIKIRNIFANTNGWSVFWLTDTKHVYTNGYNECHQLGVGDKEHRFIPTRIVQLTNIIKLSSADRYSLALDVDGTVWSTTHSIHGGNVHGRFANDDNYGWKRIRTLNGIRIVDIDNGDEHSLFLSSKGMVYSVGRGDHHRLGNGLRGTNRTVLPIPYFNKNRVFITSIACGRAHNLCIDDANNVWSWGCNFVGQCGSDRLGICTPHCIESLKGKNVCKIKCGTEHSYVQTTQKHYLFGSNNHNECSLIDVAANTMPVPYAINHVVERETTGHIKAVYLGSNSTMILICGVFKKVIKQKQNQKEKEKGNNLDFKLKLKKKTNTNTKTKQVKSGKHDQETVEKTLLKNKKYEEEKAKEKEKEVEKLSKLQDTLSSNKASIASLSSALSSKNSEIIKLNEKLSDYERKHLQYVRQMEAHKAREMEKSELDRELEKIKQLRKEMEAEAAAAQQKKNLKFYKKKQLRHVHTERTDRNDRNNNNDTDDEKGSELKNMNALQLLKMWQLGQYAQMLMNLGYEEIEDWRDLSIHELTQMNFKPGHAKRFVRKRNEFFNCNK